MASPVLSRHPEHGATAQATGRRYELDWLRVLIIIGLIPFHVIGLYAIAIETYIRGGRSSALAGLISNVFILWPMSLLFLVAGASTWFALGVRLPRQYVRERLLRLFIPFLFATLVIIPIQVYAVLHTYPQLINLNIVPNTGMHGGESFFELYFPYLGGYVYFLTHFTSLRESVFWGHIWFIPRLLFYALAALPLLLWLRSEPASRFIERLADMFILPGTTMLLGLLIALPRIVSAALYRTAKQSSSDVSWDPYLLWTQLVIFLLCFLAGYLFYASPRLLQAIRRDGLVALALGVFLFTLLQTPIGNTASITQITPGGILMILLRSASEWFLVIGVLYVGIRFFAFSNDLLQYLNEAAYPLYVIHMPVLILVGLPIITWDIPRVVALVIIVLAGLVVTLGLYEFLIKRIAALRLLFGLKPPRAKSSQRA
jgi:glucans biosynthesis protein C